MLNRIVIRRAGTVALAVAMLALVGCGGDDDEAGGGGPRSGSEVTLRAGVNEATDPTVAVLMYLPQSITVSEGTTVAWTLAGPEPHSVTFVPAGQTLPPPGSDESLFAPKPAPNDLYDPKILINSGLLPLGPTKPAPFKVRFDTAGAYSYTCVIHPGMNGTVNVVKSGDTDTQTEITARGDAELAQWSKEGLDAKRALAAKPVVSTRNADGTTTWTFEMGTTTAHTDILAFAPDIAPIKPGDRVTFVNSSAAPHTATFAGTTTLPQSPTDPKVAAPAKGPSPQTLNATEFFNTGLLPPNAPAAAAPPLAARSFTFVVPAAGNYTFVCLLHATSGMAGVLRVA
ncbi:MAG: plastocyanin/azurin family copper-binding protein [Acidimicrobiales bacterium]